MDLGRTASGEDLLIGRVRPRVADVGEDGVVEEVRVLGHDSDGGSQSGEGQLAQVVAVQRHRPLARVVQPGEQVAEGRLAAAGRPDQGGDAARPGDHLDVLQDPVGRFVGQLLAGLAVGVDLERGDRDLGRGGVAEPDLAELNLSVHLPKAERVGPLGQRGLLVEHLQHPLDRGHPSDHVQPHAGEVDHGSVDALHQGRKRDHGAEGKGATEHRPATDQVDRDQGQGAGQREGAEEDGLEHADPHRQVPDIAGGFAEPLKLDRVAAEELDEERPRHGEPLGRARGQLAPEPHPGPGQGPHPPPQESGWHHEERDQQEHRQRDLPAQKGHRGQRGDQPQRVGQR